MSASDKPKKRRRKSLKKETFKATFEGKETRIHFVLEPNVKEPIVTLEKFTRNPQLLRFGKIQVNDHTLKAYAFKNNKKIAFIRINDEYIMIDKHTVRTLLGTTLKMAKFLGIMKRRAKKKPKNKNT